MCRRKEWLPCRVSVYAIWNVQELFEWWRSNNTDIFEIIEYESTLVHRNEFQKSRRGRNCISLFLRKELSEGMIVSKLDLSGILWVILCKYVFQLPQDLYICYIVYSVTMSRIFWNFRIRCDIFRFSNILIFIEENKENRYCRTPYTRKFSEFVTWNVRE